MASSSCHVNVTEMKYEYDVFISFRGTDVRHGLLSHLKKELLREKIDIYVDDELERGDEISSSLLKAIEGSQVLLAIFSKDYASSKWCLNELVKMMECEERNNMLRNKQIVIPVFYKVDPSYVRHQEGDYGVALAKHEKRGDMLKMQKWRSALNKAAHLSGFHYPLNSQQDESDLVDEIVKDVSKKLNKFYSSESDDPTKSNGLVGIDQNIAWIKSLLTTKSEEVQKLGIWGMGGIGKTTIAYAVFDTFSRQYEGSYFLENVKDELNNHQLNYLQDELVSKLLGEETPHIIGAGKSNSSTMRKLSKKKVLIVLDNVNTPKLLKDFLEPIRIGPGSRVIVTSRDKQVFTAGGFHEIHNVKELNMKESLELFCIHAFKERQPKMGYEELSRKVVSIVKGIPLALKVFGSHLNSKSIDIWESAIKKLKYSNREIQSVLRLSYDDGLDNFEQKIFLDIAFFFKDEDKDYVIKLMDAWGFHGACGIEALQDKALITISNDNRIQMHDLIQKMGWEIVRQEDTYPGRRSRLRDAKEVYEMLKNNGGTHLVEGILLDVSQIGEVALNVDRFRSMPSLRLLKVYSPLRIDIPIPMRMRYFLLKDFENVKGVQMHDMMKIIHEESKELGTWSQLRANEDICDVLKTNRVTRAAYCMQIPNTIRTLRLIELNVEHLMDFANMKGSMLDMRKLLSKLPGIPKLVNNNECDEVLMTNNVSGSDQLMPFPSVNIGSALKELMDLGCEVHIKSLHHLFMDGCSVSKNFSEFKKEIRPLSSAETGMETLNFAPGLFSYCEFSDTEALQHENVRPEESSALPNEMRQRNLRGTRVELLNSSAGHFSSLECSDVDGLQLETLTNEVTVRRSTYYHRLSNCREQDTRTPKLQVLFDGFRCSERKLDCFSKSMKFIHLRLLVFHRCQRFRLDTVQFSHLIFLSFSRCRFLQSIADLPPSIKFVEAYNCVSLETVEFCSNTAGAHVHISIQNCRKFDAKKFSCSFQQFAWELAVASNTRCVAVCYPGSKVPKWFTCCMQGASITVELALPSNYPFSCLLCLVLSPSSSYHSIKVECQSYSEDGNMPRYATKKCVSRKFWKNLKSDHVCMWYLDSHFLREIMEGTLNDPCTSSSYDPKVTFQFSVVVKAHSDMPKQELDGLIKECGVCPLYLRDYHNFVETKRHRDFFDLETTGIGNGVGSYGDQEPLPSTQKQKGLV